MGRRYAFVIAVVLMLVIVILPVLRTDSKLVENEVTLCVSSVCVDNTGGLLDKCIEFDEQLIKISIIKEHDQRKLQIANTGKACSSIK